MFRRIKNTLLGLLCLCGLGFIGQNFSEVPKSKLMGKVSSALPQQLENILPKEKPKAVEGPQKRYVKIEGQYYEYNSRNVYMVKGVPTYYIDGSAKREPPKTVDKIENKEDQNEDREKVQGMVERNALGVYTPQGMKAMINEASRLRKDMQERHRALDSLEE